MNNMIDEDGNLIANPEEREVLAVVDQWLAEGEIEDPEDDELLDIAAIMAAHDENPFG